MQVKHVSAYLDEDVYEGMEELRRDERRRTRSEWINQAVLEKVPRRRWRDASRSFPPEKDR